MNYLSLSLNEFPRCEYFSENHPLFLLLCCCQSWLSHGKYSTVVQGVQCHSALGGLSLKFFSWPWYFVNREDPHICFYSFVEKEEVKEEMSETSIGSDRLFYFFLSVVSHLACRRDVRPWGLWPSRPIFGLAENTHLQRPHLLTVTIVEWMRGTKPSTSQALPCITMVL